MTESRARLPNSPRAAIHPPHPIPIPSISHPSPRSESQTSSVKAGGWSWHRKRLRPRPEGGHPLMTSPKSSCWTTGVWYVPKWRNSQTMSNHVKPRCFDSGSTSLGISLVFLLHPRPAASAHVRRASTSSPISGKSSGSTSDPPGAAIRSSGPGVPLGLKGFTSFEPWHVVDFRSTWG